MKNKSNKTKLRITNKIIPHGVEEIVFFFIFATEHGIID